MPLGDITGYELGKFVHVLAAVVGLGATFGYGVFMGFADRFAPHASSTVLRASQVANRYLVTPALILILISGIYMVADYDIEGEAYVTVGFIAVFALLGMVHGFFAPRTRRAIELAERDIADGGELSPEYRQLAKQLALGGQIAGFITAVTIFFMVVKP
jgi:uncharacterized membrane protein